MKPAFSNAKDQAREIRRRAFVSAQDLRFLCCSAYKTARGYWQCESNLEWCKEGAVREETYLVHLPMKPEDFYAGMQHDTLDVRTGKVN